MKRFKIYSGLGGGFGGSTFRGIEEHKSQFDASMSAYEQAIETYQEYEGLHGLRTKEELMEEEDIDDEEEGGIAYNEEMEDWLDYHVVEILEGIEIDEDGEEVEK